MRMLSAIFALALLAPLAMADPAQTPVDRLVGDTDRDCAALDDREAPCGWIAPIIDLRFPEKPDCGSGPILGVDPGPETCMVPPRDGESVTVEGTLNWYWDVSNDGTYPNEPLEDILIEFRTSPGNPDWIQFEVDPPSFTVTSADLFSPQYFRTEGEPPGATVYYWKEEPITVTFTRNGDPDGEELRKMEDRDGVQPVFVRVQSSASGDRIREGFGIEEFRFHGANDPDVAGQLNRDTPAPAVLPVLGVVAAAAIFVRRRW